MLVWGLSRPLFYNFSWFFRWAPVIMSFDSPFSVSYHIYVKWSFDHVLHKESKYVWSLKYILNPTIIHLNPTTLCNCITSPWCVQLSALFVYKGKFAGVTGQCLGGEWSHKIIISSHKLIQNQLKHKGILLQAIIKWLNPINKFHRSPVVQLK